MDLEELNQVCRLRTAYEQVEGHHFQSYLEGERQTLHTSTSAKSDTHDDSFWLLRQRYTPSSVDTLACLSGMAQTLLRRKREKKEIGGSERCVCALWTTRDRNTRARFGCVAAARCQ